MTFANRLRRTGWKLTAVAAAGWLVGCTAPPSVVPLLDASRRIVLAEAQRIEAGGAIDEQSIEQAKLVLADAFEADLAQQDALDAQWVREATVVYVAAREQLVEQAMRLREQRRVRADNLRAAAEAQQRAVALLQRQDALITQTTGLNIWRLIAPATPLDVEIDR